MKLSSEKLGSVLEQIDLSRCTECSRYRAERVPMPLTQLALVQGVTIIVARR